MSDGGHERFAKTRRGLLAALGAATSSAGCLGLFESSSEERSPSPSTHENPSRRVTTTATSATSRTTTTEHSPSNTSTAPGSNSNVPAWPRRHFDAANSDYNPDGRGPSGSLTRQWSVARGDPMYGWPTVPIVADGTAFFGAMDGAVYAIDIETGSQQWSAELLQEGNVRSTPMYVDGTLFVNDGGTTIDENGLHALDASTGERLWNETYGGERAAPPNEYDGILYFGSWDQEFVAVESPDGQEQWNHDTLVRMSRMAAVDNRGVYVSFYDPLYPGGVIGYDRMTGGRLWTFREAPDDTLTPTNQTTTATKNATQTTTHSGTAATESPSFQPAVALDDNTVYFASAIGKLFSINKFNGAERWSRKMESPLYASPVVTQEAVYVGTAGGAIYAIDKATGDTLWSAPTTDKNSEGPTGSLVAAVVNETIYVQGHGIVIGFDAATGEQRWRFETKDLMGGLVVTPERIIARTREEIVAFGPG